MTQAERKCTNGNGEEYSDFLSFYQVEGVNFLLENKRVLIADDMGVGKTAQAVAGKLQIENETGRRVKTLVVAPNSVKDHWAKKIEEYCERKQSVVKLDDYSEKSLGRLKDADFAIVNYDVFGRRGGNNELTERLLAEDFGYVVLDEVHNIKNPDAFRSGKVKRLADSADYLCLLSGTPIPNNLKDIYMLISLLEKDAYRTPEDVRKAHWDQPRVLRVVLNNRRIRRELNQVTTLPPISYNTELEGVLDMDNRQREIYQAVFDNDELEGSRKLQELRKALLDPSLVDSEVVFDKRLKEMIAYAPSVKYNALDGVIKEKTDGGKKVVVFSPLFKRGVTKKLEERYSAYGALRIDGDVPESEREGIRKRFQYSDGNNVLIATTATTGEGISLNAASTVVLLDEPYTPAEREQAIKRVYRRGQKNEVDVISLAVKDSVDEGVLELLKWKKEGIEFIENGRELKPEHVEALVKDWRSRFVTQRMYSPHQRILRYSSRMTDKGSQMVRKALTRKNGRIAIDYAENYCKDWDTSYSANTARAYKQVIEGLSEIDSLDRKVDLGSGPGILSHILGERTVNVDLNEKNYKQPLSDAANGNILASMHELPLRDGSFDLTVASNSLNYLSDTGNERANAIIEARRVLGKGGYFILTLPYNVASPNSTKSVERAVSDAGFEIVPELTGYVKSATEAADFRVYMCVSRKDGLEPVTSGQNFALEKRKRIYTMRKKGVCDSFVYFDPDGTFEERIGDRLMKYTERL